MNATVVFALLAVLVLVLVLGALGPWATPAVVALAACAVLVLVAAAEAEEDKRSQGFGGQRAPERRYNDYVDLTSPRRVIEARQALQPTAPPAPVQRRAETRYGYGARVAHTRSHDGLVRTGKVVGVHLDDPANGVYYTVLLDNGHQELQAHGSKLRPAGARPPVGRQNPTGARDKTWPSVLPRGRR
jgi:hypothetical protein